MQQSLELFKFQITLWKYQINNEFNKKVKQFPNKKIIKINFVMLKSIHETQFTQFNFKSIK